MKNDTIDIHVENMLVRFRGEQAVSGRACLHMDVRSNKIVRYRAENPHAQELLSNAAYATRFSIDWQKMKYFALGALITAAIIVGKPYFENYFFEHENQPEAREVTYNR